MGEFNVDPGLAIDPDPALSVTDSQDLLDRIEGNGEGLEGEAMSQS